jgi:DNA-binding PucR family transcriptional regulator
MRVAGIARRGPGTLTSFEDVEIASVCSGDPDWCRAFVRAELGRLAEEDEATRRVRATLEAFFAAESNFRATAKRLGVHHNTVRYRLARAEELLGRPPAERRLALEVALHLASRLGTWALSGEE